MKKFCVLLLCFLLLTPAFAEVDKSSYEYLKNKKSFLSPRAMVEHIAEKQIEKFLVEETGGIFKVKFKGYTISSIKKGIFKYLEINGQNLVIENIDVPFLHIKTLSDYHRLNINEKPIKIITDAVLDYEVHLSENSINQALNTKEYFKTLNKINDIAYPLFVLYNLDVLIVDNKLQLIIEYNFPISPRKNNRKFIVNSNFAVKNGKIYATDVTLDKAYGRLEINKVTNLINLLDPLSFTLSVLDSKKCKGNIENVKIEDNIIKINGKIYVKGEQ